MKTKTSKEIKVAESTEKEVIPVINIDYNEKMRLLTPHDKEKYLAMTEKIMVNDIASVQGYGNELSTVISHNGDQLLASVQADNTNEVVEMTNDLLKQLNLIDIDDIADTRWKRFLRRMPILKRLVKSAQNLLTEYQTVSENVSGITKKIGSAKVVALRDNSTLQTIFDNDVAYIAQIQDLILAAKVKLEELEKERDKMEQDPNIAPIEVSDANNFINALQKRVADMETQEYILKQNLFQIRAAQHNNLAIADKSDNIVTNIIPVWKDQIALAIIMQNQRNSVEAETKIAETTNEMLKKNAEALHINSVNVARESERQVVDIETLNKVTQNLIETVKEVKAIHDQGAQERKAIEASLQEFANQINKNILEA